MKCPKCGSENGKVLETRQRQAGLMRRRKCLDCDVTFRTLEGVVQVMEEARKPGRPKKEDSDALNWDFLSAWNRHDPTAATEIAAGHDDPAPD